MKKYLKISEASKLTGKHSDTIRTFVKNHPEAVKKEGNKYYIKTEILAKYYALNEPAEESESEDFGATELLMENLLSSQREEIDYLRAELEKKNELIAKQSETIEKVISQQNALIAQSNAISNRLLGTGTEEQKTEPIKTKKKFGLFRKK